MVLKDLNKELLVPNQKQSQEDRHVPVPFIIEPPKGSREQSGQERLEIPFSTKEGPAPPMTSAVLFGPLNSAEPQINLHLHVSFVLHTIPRGRILQIWRRQLPCLYPLSSWRELCIHLGPGFTPAA